MYAMKREILLICFILLSALTGYTQGWNRQDTPNDSLVPAEVLPDGRVAFRIYAPKAQEVSLGGEEDIAWKNCRKMLELFDRHGVTYEYSEMPGGHTWYVWRHDLYNFAPLLFK